MDIYSTQVLNRVVEETPANPSFLLNTFFPLVETSDTETIMFDTVKGRRRISPFVAPHIEGQVITEAGFETNSFKPAYIKDKRVFEPGKQFKRRAGEKIGGSLTPAQRLRASVGLAVADQLEMWTRRLEVMAAEVLLTGKAVISGEKYPTQTVDFKRDAGLTVTLLGNDKWSHEDSAPLDDIEEWAGTIFRTSGVVVKDVIFAMDVWQAIREKKNVKDKLDTQVKTLNENKAFFGPLVLGADGYRLVAVFGDFRLWVYQNFYEHPVTGIDTPVLPDGHLIMASAKGVEGVRHFGAIKDLKAGLQPREFFMKSWENEDPSVRYMLGQSAPLLVPYHVNTTLGAKVL